MSPEVACPRAARSSPAWALLWKEWRSFRAVAVGLILASLVTGWAARSVTGRFAPATLPLHLSVVIGSAILLGASVFASEKSDGTVAFADQLPVSRWTAWAVKAAFAYGAWAVIFLSPPLTWLYPVANTPLLLQMAAVGWVSLGMSALWGVLLDRPLTSVAASVACLMALLVISTNLMRILNLGVTPEQLRLLAVLALIPSPVPLLLSAWCYARGWTLAPAGER